MGVAGESAKSRIPGRAAWALIPHTAMCLRYGLVPGPHSPGVGFPYWKTWAATGPGSVSGSMRGSWHRTRALVIRTVIAPFAR